MTTKPEPATQPTRTSAVDEAKALNRIVNIAGWVYDRYRQPAEEA